MRARSSRTGPWKQGRLPRRPGPTPRPRRYPPRPRLRGAAMAPSLAPIERHAHHGPGQHERRPRKQGERALAGVGPEVPLERIRPRRQPCGVADGGRRHRDDGRARRQRKGPRQAGARHPPDTRRGHDGRPHDVQDVDLQQTRRVREAAERVGLQAEHEREQENLPPAPLHQPRRLHRRSTPAHVRGGRQCDRDTGHEQESWRGHAAQHHQPAIRGARLLVGTGPGIKRVRLDHHQHGDATQPVQVTEPAGGARCTHEIRQPGRCSSWSRA